MNSLLFFFSSQVWYCEGWSHDKSGNPTLASVCPVFARVMTQRDYVTKSRVLSFQSEKWRREYGADTILETWKPPEVMKQFWPGGIFGVDKKGHPILYQLSKNFNSKGSYSNFRSISWSWCRLSLQSFTPDWFLFEEMMKCVRKQDIIKYHVWRMEKLMRACQESSKKVKPQPYPINLVHHLCFLSWNILFTVEQSHLQVHARVRPGRLFCWNDVYTRQDLQCSSPVTFSTHICL